MNFNDVKEKATCVAGDIKDGLAIMDRYVLRRDVRSRTVLTDTQNGNKVIDTEDEYSREYPVVKLVIGAFAVIVGVVAVMSAIKKSVGRKKMIKLQKKEIKRLRKLCKDADIDISDKKK